ncbi:dTMP kinase [Myxococcota bacterium]|nr:dTMP kinase [Myxococcota bacterium]
MRGRLIVLEGIDGSGKTTLAKGLVRALEVRGHGVVSTREPTDGPLGRQIRQIAATGRDGVTPEQELELFHQDRAAHVRDVVRPALADGKIVVQDRSYFSTIAYQGERGLDRGRILAMSEQIAPRPDLLLVVDVPAELAVERIHRSRGSVADDFEKVESLRRIRDVFLGFAHDAPGDGAVVLDGRLGVDALLARALDAVDAHLGLGA